MIGDHDPGREQMRLDNMDARRPIVNISDGRVALGPLRDEHFEAIARWENDYGTERYFTAPGPRRPEDTRRNFTEGDFSGPTNVVFALYEVASWTSSASLALSTWTTSIVQPSSLS